jgi:hypothetical protein
MKQVVPGIIDLASKKNRISCLRDFTFAPQFKN